MSRCQSRRGHVLCDPNIVSLMSAVDFGRSAAAIDLHVCRPDSFSRKIYAPLLLDKFKKVRPCTGYFRRESPLKALSVHGSPIWRASWRGREMFVLQ